MSVILDHYIWLRTFNLGNILDFGVLFAAPALWSVLFLLSLRGPSLLSSMPSLDPRFHPVNPIILDPRPTRRLKDQARRRNLRRKRNRTISRTARLSRFHLAQWHAAQRQTLPVDHGIYFQEENATAKCRNYLPHQNHGCCRRFQHPGVYHPGGHRPRNFSCKQKPRHDSGPRPNRGGSSSRSPRGGPGRGNPGHTSSGRTNPGHGRSQSAPTPPSPISLTRLHTWRALLNQLTIATSSFNILLLVKPKWTLKTVSL